MKSRGAVLAAAFVLAALATAAISLYVHGLKQNTSSGPGVGVVVAKQDITAGTQLDGLISAGAFKTVNVPKDEMVRDAVTSLTQLQGQTTSVPILAGGQVSLAFLQGSQDVSGGVLGIPKGYEGVTIPLDEANAAGGTLQRGDHVTVYGVINVSNGVAATASLIPDAEVLKVDATGTTSSQTLVTLAVHPFDGQRLVYAQTQGTVWLALLPPNQKGLPTAPVTSTQAVH